MDKKKLFLLIFVLAALLSCGSSKTSVSESCPLQAEAGVVINGVRWATRNVAAPGTFAANPQDAGMFYQWGRSTGWSTTNVLRQWDNNRNRWVTAHWITAVAPGSTWTRDNDPCPAGWRVPAQSELDSLRSAGSTWTSNWRGTGVRGRVFGTYPYQIFLPAMGLRDSTTGERASGPVGRYWSSGRMSLLFNSSSVGGIGEGSRFISRSDEFSVRTSGFLVRCVAED
jgi:hypothetical protein